MHSSRDHLSPDEIERQLYESEAFLDGLFPQSQDDIKELQAMFGTTPVRLPEQLREPEVVLERIAQKEATPEPPSEFGKLVTILRTEKKLSIGQLADKTDLDVGDLIKIESDAVNQASPLAVTAIAEYFKLQPQQLMRLAGLTKECSNLLQGELSVAAYAKPTFDSLSHDDRILFHELVKQLRKKV